MLIWFVVLYLMLSIGIGLYAATRVHTAKDFAVAGRHLPLPVVTATVFATWFGAEAVFGVSATFVKDGLRGVVADPFGSCAVPDHRRLLLRQEALQAQRLDARRLLPHALQPHRGSSHHTVHRRLLPRLGLCADQGARPGIQRRHQRLCQPDGRDDPRRSHRAHLHHLRWHAFGGHPRLRPDGRHHRRHAISSGTSSPD